MSDRNLPQPLPGIHALRMHLKALERGVANARSERLGVDHPGAAGSAPASTAGTTMIGSTGSHVGAKRPDASPYNGLSSKPAGTPGAATNSARASGKPRAARAKSASDFSAFFDSIDKRTVG